MVRLPAPFNARLYNIQEAFKRDDPGPLVAYLRSGTVDPDIQEWLGDRIDPATTDGSKLVIRGPHHRPRGGKALDRSLDIAEAVNRLMNDRADQRTEETKVLQVAAEFRCSESKVRKDYRNWKKAREV